MKELGKYLKFLGFETVIFHASVKAGTPFLGALINNK